MSGHLEQELSIPPLEKELTSRWSADGRAAKDEGTGTESEVLLSLFSLDADQFDPVQLSQHLTRNFQRDVAVE
jgi:hypothetical protein